jgi:deoxyribodipyrimidine photo-lyase
MEVGARTIRRKIMDRLSSYLQPFHELPTFPAPVDDEKEKVEGDDNGDGKNAKSEIINWEEILENLNVDRSVPEVDWIQPGSRGGNKMVDSFLRKRLIKFEDKRNNPNEKALSNLSPYYHYGQISPAAVAMKIKMSTKGQSQMAGSVAAFIEESIVRRELADNYCNYNLNYDNLDAAANWAKETLLLHASDPKEHTYSLEELERGDTHDELWNAAQLQVVQLGKMHGFLRMYWAKKILEWTADGPEEALRVTLYLNDKYQLDGRDPNGFTGCAWSIIGIHDQGWGERATFGKIRYMNYQGCKRKFDVAEFVTKYPQALKSALKRGGGPAVNGKKKK